MTDVLKKSVAELNLDRSDWQLVKFGDVAIQQKQTVDRENTELTRYVKGEHMYSEDIHLRKWGELKDEYLGPAFIRKFEEGDILYGSRRTYLRKVVVAPFEGITSNTTFVIKANEEKIDKRLLPFIMLSEGFSQHSIKNSKGSVNPYVNWKDLSGYEFLLPPKSKQNKLLELLITANEYVEANRKLRDDANELLTAYVAEITNESVKKHGVVTLDTLIADDRPITYGILKPGKGHPNGIPVIKVRDYPEGVIKSENLLLTSPVIEEPYRRSRLKTGDLLISIRGTVGRLTEVPEALNGANITQDTARLSLKPMLCSSYVRVILESDFIQHQIKVRTTGLAVQGINLSELKKLKVPCPPFNEQTEIGNKVLNIKSALSNTNESLTTLNLLFKSLINQVF